MVVLARVADVVTLAWVAGSVSESESESLELKEAKIGRRCKLLSVCESDSLSLYVPDRQSFALYA